MSCLNKKEKVEVMDMLYKYRPYHVREEDKVFMDKEMKRLCYMGILKEGFSA